MSESVGIKLKNKLLELYNDREFAIGVMTNAKTEENWKTLLDIIENEKGIDSDRLSLISLALGE